MVILKTTFCSKGDVYFIAGENHVDSKLVNASRQSIRNALQERGFNVMCYEGPLVFLEEIKRSSPAVLLFDTRLNDWSGTTLQKNLKQLEHELPIIFMGKQGSTKEIVTAMKQGAVDFLAEPFTLEDLCGIVEKAMALNVDNKARDAIENDLCLRLKMLTTREREICFLMVGGYGNIEIAAFNGSTAGTVKIHRHRVLKKMGVQTLAALVMQMNGIEHTRGHLLNLKIASLEANTNK